MKRSSRNYLIGVLILTVAILFLLGCATKKDSTQPSGTADQAKPASDPSTKAQETTTPPSSPTKTTTTTSPPSSPSSKTPEVSQPPAARTTEIALAFVNLRQGPSMDSKIINVLKKGQVNGPGRKGRLVACSA
jgi:cytoskeletal protein RodZ